MSRRRHIHLSCETLPGTVSLSDADIIGAGGQKTVYAHPADPALCIKIPKNEPRKIYGCRREVMYTLRHQDAMACLAPCLGVQETSLGTGYVFELVRDYDGGVSATLEDSLPELDPGDVLARVNALQESLIANLACVNDPSAANILIQRHSPTPADYTFRLIDGFGNAEFIKICDVSRIFLRRKVSRLFDTLRDKTAERKNS